MKKSGEKLEEYKLFPWVSEMASADFISIMLSQLLLTVSLKLHYFILIAKSILRS